MALIYCYRRSGPRQTRTQENFTANYEKMVRHGNNMITVQPANQIPGGDGPGTGRSSTPSANVDDDHDVQDISDHPRSSFSSDATPRPTPVPSYPLIAQDSYTSQGSISDSVHLSPAAKRLAFFTDKLAAATHSQSHSPSRASPVPFHSVHLPPRSHSRADSGPWDSSAMASASSTSNLKQVHTSPSKVSPIRHPLSTDAQTRNNGSQRRAGHTIQDSYREKCIV